MDSRTAKIHEGLGRRFHLPHQAAAMALQLFVLLVEHGDAQQTRGLIARFVEALSASGMSDLLCVQMAYARRLAESTGPLQYEEMHKLFSLCDEIGAMRMLGLTEPDQVADSLEHALRSRFALERSKARLVADDKVTPWNRDFWWYAENVTKVEPQGDGDSAL